MYNVFVSNDDGINAAGIKALVRSLAEYCRVYVVAPIEQQSAKSMSLTMWDDVKAREVDLAGAEWAWELSGTPCDCVKFGLQKCREHGVEIDYVIGGINHGANMGMDVLYSGTVACATEGALCGYKAMALSVYSHESTDFGYICDMLPELFRMSDDAGPCTVLSVNTPDLPAEQVKGVRVVPLGPRGFDVTLAARGAEEPDMYHYKGYGIDYAGSGEDFDLVAITKGYAVITPLSLDRTDERLLCRLRSGGYNDGALDD